MTRKLVFAAVTVVVGIVTFLVLVTVSKDESDPLLAACVNYQNASMEEFVQETGYHPFSKEVGFGVIDPYVCLTTNFLVGLVNSFPGGMINWFATVNLLIPVSVSWLVEAGRLGAVGPIRYPMITCLLSVLLGVSVAVPLIWIPSYVYGRGKPATVSPLRAWSAFVVGVFNTSIQTVPLFVLDVDGHFWRIVAGLVLSYEFVPLYLPFWFMPPKDVLVDKDVTVQSIQAVARAYTFSGIISFFIWIFLLYVVVTEYGADYGKLWSDVFGTANGFVRFMFVDFLVLWISMLLYIAYHDVRRFAKALALSFVWGPGSAVSASMAELELESCKVASGASKKED